MSFFKPNLVVGSDWQGTLMSAFLQLRGPAFAVEDTFKFQDFDPMINWNGMTVTTPDVQNARYVKIGKFFYFTLRITIVGIPAAATNVFYWYLPNNFLIRRPATAGAANVDGAADGVYFSGATLEPLFSIARGSTGRVEMFRLNLANFANAASTFMVNGFYEVE
jgi:hypothetical protein